MAHSAAYQKRDWKVLCLDGGGVRGVIEGVFLKEVERQTGKRICQLFDMICGTSTGGILAMMLGMFHMTCQEALDTYTTLCGDIFAGKPDTEKLLRTGEKYNTAGFEVILKRTLDQFIAGTGLVGIDSSQALMETIPPGYHTPDGLPTPHVFMVSRRADLEISPGIYLWANYPVINLAEGSSRELMWKCIRATSAAPSYFKTIEIGGRLYMDGGIGNNNPIFRAFQQLAHFNADLSKSFICSVGCGQGDPKVLTPFKAQMRANQGEALKKLGSDVEFVASRAIGKVAPVADLAGSLLPALLTAATDSDEPWVDAEAVLRVCHMQDRAVRLQIPHTAEDLADITVVPALIRRTEAALGANSARLARVAAETGPAAKERRSGWAAAPGVPQPRVEGPGRQEASLPENRLFIGFELRHPSSKRADEQEYALDCQCQFCLLVDHGQLLERNVRLFREYKNGVSKLAEEATPDERQQAKEMFQSESGTLARAEYARALLEWLGGIYQNAAYGSGAYGTSFVLGSIGIPIGNWVAKTRLKIGQFFSPKEEDLLAKIVARRKGVDLDAVAAMLPPNLLSFSQLVELAVPELDAKKDVKTMWKNGVKKAGTFKGAIANMADAASFVSSALISCGWDWALRSPLQKIVANLANLGLSLPYFNQLKTELLDDEYSNAAVLYTIQTLYNEGKLLRAVGYEYGHPFRGTVGKNEEGRRESTQTRLDPDSRIFLCHKHLADEALKRMELNKSAASTFEGSIFLGLLQVVTTAPRPAPGSVQIVPVTDCREQYTAEGEEVKMQALAFVKGGRLAAPLSAASPAGSAGRFNEAPPHTKRKQADMPPEVLSPAPLRPGQSPLAGSNEGSPYHSPFGSPPPSFYRDEVARLQAQNRANGYAGVARVAD